MTLNELFKNTTYDDTLFSVEDKSTIESRIFMKSVRGSEVPYITCAIRDKEIKLTPEEAVRQLYIYKLMNDYGYAASRIQLETPIHFGREVKRADIAIMDKDRPMVPYIIVEMSRNVQSGNTQNLKSMVIQRSFPKWSVAERRKTAAASNQAACCACTHSRYLAGGSPSGLRV